MRFILKLRSQKKAIIPINYQYPFSSAIYRILSKGDAEYASFLHEEGYGKGFKFFTFSDLRGKFKVTGDRMHLYSRKIEFTVCFHLPEASQTFIQGLFKSEEIVIADKKSKGSFQVTAVLSRKNPLPQSTVPHEIIQVAVRPISPLVIGSKRADGKYHFKAPTEEGFIESLLYSWRSKIKEAYSDSFSEDCLLSIEVIKHHQPARSRLIHIKQGTPEETKIRGWLHFNLQLTAEKRFIDLILNAGLGLYSAQGMGCLEVIANENK